MSKINKLLEKIRLLSDNPEIISCINKIIFLRNDERLPYPHCPNSCGYSLSVTYWCPTHGTIDETDILWKARED